MNERIHRAVDATEGAARWAGEALSKTKVWASLLLVAALGVGFGLGSWRNLCAANCPSIAQIRTWEPQQTSKVLSHDGQLIGELGIERRTPVSIATVPAHLPQAFIAIEDRRFYEHGGFDPRGLSRAVLARLVPDPVFRVFLGTSLRQGGASTITQQLARNMFDAIGFESEGFAGILRKLKELQVALELERAYSKEQILEAYINEIYLGPGWYGVQTASRNYFGKEAVALNPAESALLAAVANNAGFYSPFRFPERAAARRDFVLDRMAIEGFLSGEEAAVWKAEPLPAARAMASDGIAPYFVEWVRQLVQERFGPQTYTSGFQIITTLDVDMQRAADVALSRGFARIESRPGYPHITYDAFVEQGGGQPLVDVVTPYVQGIFIAADPRTGAVKAMIGGRDFTHSKFNRALQAMRQPGSSFKPFVYASALAAGIPASRVIADRPYVYEQVSGELWTPENFSGTFEGDMTLRQAFRTSTNTVAIRLADEVGLESVAQFARRLGISTEIPRVPSIAIGSAEVLPIEMMGAYSTFANLGVRSEPFPILRVETADGEIVWEPLPERTQVLDPLVARAMVSLMEDVVARGTGASIRGVIGLPYDVPAAGKTGTTNESTDVWFNGFTPNLQATVWFGLDQPQPLYAGATSGEATPVWGEFMRMVYVGDLAGDETAEDVVPVVAEGDVAPVDVAQAYRPGRPLLEVPAPWPLDGLLALEVDAQTGLLASRWCPAERRYLEFYIPGTEPSEQCDDTAPGPSRFQFPF